MNAKELSDVESFLAGRVVVGPDRRPSIPPVVSRLVDLAMASPDVLKEIPYLNDDWIKVAGFRRGSMDVDSAGGFIVPQVVKDLVRLGMRIQEREESAGPPEQGSS